MVGAHAGADTSAVHYTSKALRRDAWDGTTGMVKEFMTVTSRLKQAKFHNAGDLAAKLAEKEEEIAALKRAYQQSPAS